VSAVREIAPGIRRWTARHPQWHPSADDDFGREVGSYALSTEDGDLLLVDPLVAEEATQDALDALADAARATAILVTIGYHVRSAPALAARYGATVHGPPQAGKRLKGAKGATFAVLEPGAPGPAGVVAHAIGRPRRGETPLYFPSHRALAFGDALVATPAGELRMWSFDPDEPSRRAFYRERFAPTLQPLVDLEPDHVLVTHGEPVLGTGAAALRAAAAADVWFHAG
jgi:glyoxylase-like metal-dependent hydrolase (beta-lactamase superfamily II)